MAWEAADSGQGDSGWDPLPSSDTVRPRMDALVKSVSEQLRRQRLLAGGETVVVGVSGGVDSMVLLHILHRLAAKRALKLVVAHVNHGLRGRESDRDERFVTAAAESMGLPIRSLRVRVDRSRKAGESMEMAARRVRHAFLLRVQKQRKAHAIALAHHADDQLELFFLRLFRGSGGSGLVGMGWESPSPTGEGGRIIRPLLHSSREGIEAYAKRAGLKWRTDASNQDTTILRNRLRHDLLPLLRGSYCAGLNAVILRTMELLGGDAACAEALRQLVDQDPSIRSRLSGPVVSHLDSLDARRALRQGREPVSYASVQAQKEARRGERVSTAGDTISGFRRGSKAIVLTPERGSVTVKGFRLEWWELQRPIPFNAVPLGLEQMDAQKVGRKIRLRHWRAGDRFQPLGMKSAVKLQDLFVNRKVPVAERRSRWLAVAEDDRIFWVQGLPPGDCYKITPKTARVLCFQGSGVP